MEFARKCFVWLLVGGFTSLYILAGLHSARRDAGQLQVIINNRDTIKKNERTLLESKEMLTEMKEAVLQMKRIQQQHQLDNHGKDSK